MSLAAQALYFHLCMYADDDGFVKNPKRIFKMIGAHEDDFRLLIMKRFILTYESGVIVIKHWRMHNLLRSDRYKETEYVEEKSMLRIKENGAYTLDETQGKPIKKVGNRLATKRQPSGNLLATQDSIGKDSIGKNSIGKKNTYGEYAHVKLKQSEYETLITELGQTMTDECIKFLDEYIEMKGYKAKSHYLCIKKWVIDAVKRAKPSIEKDYDMIRKWAEED
jgi:hypothetical protein